MTTTTRFNLLLPNGTEQVVSEDVEQTVLSLIRAFGAEKNWPDAMVIQGDGEDSGWLHLFSHGDFGWLVVCCGDNDAFEYFLIEGDSTEEIEVKKAGLIDKYKRKQFVRFELAEKAIIEFVRSGNCLASLCWEELGI
ncbi:hypothetical protein [Stieleria varia]|uniref:Uncharacterized protein n=1 Tax=Stieleria varia TaxID=2528005 RepID=A0A5C6AN16_9BACT|nr:hypothetical protein [Stieleria varia]TWU00908.1 hypothetical protein Pla52n_42770 [Stieleria varia]